MMPRRTDPGPGCCAGRGPRRGSVALTVLVLSGLALSGLALSGCAGHPASSATGTDTRPPSPTASARPSPSLLPDPVSGTGLRVVAGHPVRFGADSTPGVSGTFTLTCAGQGIVRLQPSKGTGTDLTCGGTSELRTAPGGTLVTATTTGTAPLTLDWSLRLSSG
jgi:hypothetical protein